jgi:hypothetical protein
MQPAEAELLIDGLAAIIRERLASSADARAEPAWVAG